MRNSLKPQKVAKEFVLMSIHNADLMVGVRISVFDQEWSDDIQPCDDDYRIFVGSYDGWLMYHPTATNPFWVYFNREEEGVLFEVLGEL